jgi:hypothetical protein
VFECFVPADRAITVTPAQGERQAGTGRRQSLESEVGEQPRSANVPGIREHEYVAASVEITELLAAPGALCASIVSPICRVQAGLAGATDKPVNFVMRPSD